MLRGMTGRQLAEWAALYHVEADERQQEALHADVKTRLHRR